MEIVTLLNKAVNEALAIPEVRAGAARFGMEARGSGIDELRERIKREVAKWAKVAEAAGLEKR